MVLTLAVTVGFQDITLIGNAYGKLYLVLEQSMFSVETKTKVDCINEKWVGSWAKRVELCIAQVQLI